MQYRKILLSLIFSLLFTGFLYVPLSAVITIDGLPEGSTITYNNIHQKVTLLVDWDDIVGTTVGYDFAVIGPDVGEEFYIYAVQLPPSISYATIPVKGLISGIHVIMLDAYGPHLG